MSHTNTNGRTERKTLASQLDRLDNTIDALADGLNRFVADAVREAITAAVSQTVEAVLRELLSRPELLRQLAGQTVPTTATAVEPGKPSKLKRLCNSVWQKIRNGWAWLALKGSAKATGAKEKATGLWQRMCMVPDRVHDLMNTGWRHKRQVAIATGAGMVIGLGSYAAGPLLAAIACGVSSMVLILGLQALLPYHGMLRSMMGSTS
jgi:hypothetical protein